MAPPQCVLRTLDTLATLSPCAKSKRGVVVYDPATSVVVGAGFNAPPKPFACDATDSCRRDCSKICIHAEAMAIYAALEHRHHLHRLELVHGRFVAGTLVTSGGPSCWQCSKLVLEVGLNGVWLYEHGGAWRFYAALEFHWATLAHPDNNLHNNLYRREAP